MTASNYALSKKARISHGLELYRYFMSRDFRKKSVVYDFVQNFNEKNLTTIKNYKDLEKEFNDEKLTKKKKIIQLQ